MSATLLVLFVAGLALLILGAEILLRGATRLAAAAGISPLVIGLTIVAFGTSSPELAVSVSSALSGQADLALGNVVGSNIFNVLFILGICALITPLIVSQQLVRLDVPIMIAISLLLLLLALDGQISAIEGVVLFGGIIAYTVFAIRQSRRDEAAAPTTPTTPVRADMPFVWRNLGLFAGGLGLLVLGSNWMVDSAVEFARFLGVSELVIGLTIVAAGTSLPEVAASIVAGLRGQRDIAVGNVVGSNIFNILSILGITALIAPAGVSVAPALLTFDIPVMIAAALACLPIFFTGYTIARWEGALFLTYYIAYTLFLVLAATQHDALPAFSFAMLAFVVPLTVITLAVLVVREWRRRSRESVASKQLS